MSNQSPCTDPLYPCTALTLAEKSAALEQLKGLKDLSGDLYEKISKALA